jgi:hypothetical protein
MFERVNLSQLPSATAELACSRNRIHAGVRFRSFRKLRVETVERGAGPRLRLYTQTVFQAFPRFPVGGSSRYADLVGLDAAIADWLTGPGTCSASQTYCSTACSACGGERRSKLRLYFVLSIAGRSPAACRRNDSRLRWRSWRLGRGRAAGNRSESWLYSLFAGCCRCYRAHRRRPDRSCG